MPVQWLPLQQRQQPMRSPVSEALTPRPRPVQGPVGGGFAAAGGTLPNRFVEEQKAKWAEEDKLRKMEREQRVNEAQEMGMRIQAAHRKEQARGRQMSAQTLAERGAAPAGAAPALTKENMPQAAKAMWDFILTLDEEGQKFFIQQLKKKEQPTGGYIETGGVRKEMPGRVGMYGHLVDQGLIDPATDTVIKKERIFEKGTFEIVEKGGKVYQHNTATKELTLLGTVDEPESVVAEINKDANTQALAISKASVGTADVITFTEAKFDVLKDSYNMSDEEATELSKIQELPKGKKTSWFMDIINSIIGKRGPTVTEKGWAPKGAGVAPGVGAFNEANVTSLIPVISDDVTTAERAHLKGQGASDADINEAIRRKAGE